MQLIHVSFFFFLICFHLNWVSFFILPSFSLSLFFLFYVKFLFSFSSSSLKNLISGWLLLTKMFSLFFSFQPLFLSLNWLHHISGCYTARISLLCVTGKLWRGNHDVNFSQRGTGKLASIFPLVVFPFPPLNTLSPQLKTFTCENVKKNYLN